MHDDWPVAPNLDDFVEPPAELFLQLLIQNEAENIIEMGLEENANNNNFNQFGPNAILVHDANGPLIIDNLDHEMFSSDDDFDPTMAYLDEDSEPEPPDEPVSDAPGSSSVQYNQSDSSPIPSSELVSDASGTPPDPSAELVSGGPVSESNLPEELVSDASVMSPSQPEVDSDSPLLSPDQFEECNSLLTDADDSNLCSSPINPMLSPRESSPPANSRSENSEGASHSSVDEKGSFDLICSSDGSDLNESSVELEAFSGINDEQRSTHGSLDVVVPPKISTTDAGNSLPGRSTGFSGSNLINPPYLPPLSIIINPYPTALLSCDGNLESGNLLIENSVKHSSAACNSSHSEYPTSVDKLTDTDSAVENSISRSKSETACSLDDQLSEFPNQNEHMNFSELDSSCEVSDKSVMCIKRKASLDENEVLNKVPRRKASLDEDDVSNKGPKYSSQVSNDSVNQEDHSIILPNNPEKQIFDEDDKSDMLSSAVVNDDVFIASDESVEQCATEKEKHKNE